MIVTCKKQIPGRWIAFTILPWASFAFNFAVIGAAFVFSLKKFVENPAGLTFILSLPGFLAIIVAPTASFLSDRIWTRFGRRKPFVVAASAGMITSLVVMPLVPSVWGLVAAYIFYHVCDGLSSPRDALKQEIVPPHERGRATGAMTWCQNLATVAFYSVVLGRFDDVRYFAGFPLHGEYVIYWSAALLMATMLLLITLGIREVDQKSELLGQRLSVRNIVGGLLDRELWPVYLLVISFGLLNFFSGFGPFLSTLLYTDQWGYTKQEMGVNVAIGGIVNVFIIGLLTLFADRLPRMRAFQTLIVLSLSWNAFYFCYVNFILPDKRPSLIEIILFGEVLSILSILLGLVYYPLIFDYVRRNKMGTFTAGMQICTRAIQLITLNGVGLFVWGYAVFFQPPAGEMAHVYLRHSTDQVSLLSTLRAASWSRPQDGQPVPITAITATPWQADGILPEKGRSWEIRLRNQDSEKLAEGKKRWERDRSPLTAEANRLREEAAAIGKSDQAEFLRISRAAELKQTAGDQLSTRIDGVDAELASRADKFRTQLASFLGRQMIAEGDQLLAANSASAVMVEMGTAERPEPRTLEKMLDDLRREFPSLIDLRALKRETGYGLTASALPPTLDDEGDFVEQLLAAIKHVAVKRAPALFSQSPVALTVRHEPAVVLEFQVIEQPIPAYISPVTRAVNRILAIFDLAQNPSVRLAAIARSLRLIEGINHVRVTAGSNDRTLAIAAIVQPTASQAADAHDPLGEKLRTLLGDNTGAAMLLRTRALCDRIEQSAASQHITLAHPILSSAYVSMRYDYMSGYIWVFFVGAIGLGLTFVFARMESGGTVRKRGIEEAEAT